MLPSTFRHFPQVSNRDEAILWRKGITSWQKAINTKTNPGIHDRTWRIVQKESKKWAEAWTEDDWDFIWENLPVELHWRAFPHLNHDTVYIDVEATGTAITDVITTIAAWDGTNIFTFVRNENLDDFPEFFERFQAVTTFNGLEFDLPIIEREFNIECFHFHFDLDPLMHSIGQHGGLKKIEDRLGIARPFDNQIDGLFAIKLWNFYEQSHKKAALDTLLAYNIEDAFNLEYLMYYTYNTKKTKESLPAPTLEIPIRNVPRPFSVSESIIREINEIYQDPII
jgi:uncharacterized protein YprB with RNaseH-like and TPR domain